MPFDRQLVGGALIGITIAVGSIAGATALRGTSADAGAEAADSRHLLTGADAVAMGCHPHESAIAEYVTLRGERVLHTRCVVVSPSVAVDRGADMAAASSGLMPAAFAARPAALTASPAVAPQAPAMRQVERSSRAGHTWKKSALVIGGTTAAGAGIGGAIGGKKGALVGAAIGGGGSTLYEAMKRR